MTSLTSTATILDGKAIASEMRAQMAAQVAAMRAAGRELPGLDVILVGENPASQVYVRSKAKVCNEVGFRSRVHRLSATATQEELLTLVADLNADATVHGILVQLPLPSHMDENAVINAIDPDKDVDCFHPVNVGKLTTGQKGFLPCTPQGCMILLRRALPDLRGLNAIVIGRSNIVGKPMALLLLQADCTVTIAHSRTRDLASECARADIIVAAVGRPEFVRGDWIKKGAVVIDVGINRIAVESPDGAAAKTRLVGDVNFAEAVTRAAAITPVPGGVGPMTIACLLQNTLEAAKGHQSEKV